MKSTISVALILMVFVVSGCAPPRKVPSMPESDLASLKIAESAHSVSESLIELARIQAVATPPVRDGLPSPDQYAMKDMASLDWSGPIGPAVKQIAAASNYHLRVLGRAPAVPIIITVAAKNVPLGTLLRDLAFQAGHKAKVVVYPHKKVIELRYTHV